MCTVIYTLIHQIKLTTANQHLVSKTCVQYVYLYIQFELPCINKM